MTDRSGSYPSADARIAALAAHQCNAFSRAQALSVGITKSSTSRRLRAGRWGNPCPGVYVIAGSPSSWLQDVWCAYLAAGTAAVVSHETALHLHGIHLLPRRPITLTVPHGGHARLDGVFVHQIDDLKPHRVITLSGLRVSALERVIVELAATVGERMLGRVVDEALNEKKVSSGRIAACFEETARPGKRGMDKLARVLDERGDGYVPPQSELERAMFEALTVGGLPKPRRQFTLPGRGAVEGIVDAAYPEARVLLEADGRRWHTRVDDLRRDHERDTEAARAGWLTLRFVYEQIVHEPEEVCAAIRDVLRVPGTEPRLRS